MMHKAGLSCILLAAAAAIIIASVAADKQCPDTQFSCGDEQTCCKLKDTGGYGCCPMNNATCCPDGIHCCPSGTQCDDQKKMCTPNKLALGSAAKNHLQKRVNLPQTVQCADKRYYCPDKETCCALKTGGFGCCPDENATCCSDGIQCCPSGTICNLQKNTCDKKRATTIPVTSLKSSQTPKKRKQELGILCPDKTFSCNTGESCCKQHSGYACCPLPDATCCHDGLHCCPSGTTCDLVRQTCNQGNVTKAMKASVVCPDKEYTCPDGQTCCKLESGGYGCCPMPDATCCDDKVHCCPSGTTCDTEGQTCNQGNVFSYPMSVKTKAKKRGDHIGASVVCPDKESTCPEGTTCCKMETGEYGCCPMPDAICCDDGVSCCPSGTTCNPDGQTCDDDVSGVPMLMLLKMEEETGIACPDKEYSCGDSETCCQLNSGGYGCCPMEGAVCCNDGIHCCPNGTICDLEKQTCEATGTMGFWPIFANFPLRSGSIRLSTVRQTLPAITTDEEMNLCEDGTSCLAATHACCSRGNGIMGCCPYEDVNIDLV